MRWEGILDMRYGSGSFRLDKFQEGVDLYLLYKL